MSTYHLSTQWTFLSPHCTTASVLKIRLGSPGILKSSYKIVISQTDSPGGKMLSYEVYPFLYFDPVCISTVIYTCHKKEKKIKRKSQNPSSDDFALAKALTDTIIVLLYNQQSQSSSNLGSSDAAHHEQWWDWCGKTALPWSWNCFLGQKKKAYFLMISFYMLQHPL